jgi:hypothetical protein
LTPEIIHSVNEFVKNNEILRVKIDHDQADVIMQFAQEEITSNFNPSEDLAENKKMQRIASLLIEANL